MIPNSIIAKYILILLKSIFVNLPIRANKPKINDVAKNIKIIDEVSKIINILEKVTPVNNAYTKYSIFAVDTFIVLIFAPR